MSLPQLTIRNGSPMLVCELGTSKTSWLAFPIWAPSQFPRNFHWLGFLCPLQYLSVQMSYEPHSTVGQMETTCKPSILAFMPSSPCGCSPQRTKLRLFLRTSFFWCSIQVGINHLRTEEVVLAAGPLVQQAALFMLLDLTSCQPLLCLHCFP